MKKEPQSRMDDLVHRIGELAKLTQKLAREAAHQYSAEVDAILEVQGRDSKRIERCLDGMLDFCFDDGMLALYKKLCHYYFGIDPASAVFYVNAYREMWDEQKSGKGNDLPSTKQAMKEAKGIRRASGIYKYQEHPGGRPSEVGVRHPCPQDRR